MSPKLRFPRVRSMSYHRLIITLKYLQPIHFLALRSPAPGGGSPSPSSTIRIVSSNHLPLSAAGWSPPARPPPAHSRSLAPARRPSPGRRPPPPRLRGRRPAAGGLSTRGSSLVPATARCSATGRPHCGLRSACARAPPGLLRSTTTPGKPPDSSVREATPARLPGRRLRLPPRLLPTNFVLGRPWTPPHCH